MPIYICDTFATGSGTIVGRAPTTMTGVSGLTWAHDGANEEFEPDPTMNVDDPMDPFQEYAGKHWLYLDGGALKHAIEYSSIGWRQQVSGYGGA